MKKTRIRKEALQWFRSKFDDMNARVCSSKFYLPQESWSKSRVWLFQIPLEPIYSPGGHTIYLVCENHLEGEPFICLKMSSLFFLQNLKSFDVDEKSKKLRIYLSAEAVDMFTEVRGKGKVDFKSFLIEG